MLPHPWVRGLTLPASPQMPELWAYAGRSGSAVDVVHASAFPYSFPLFAALRWARHCGAPFVLTPFLHLGDPEREDDRTRRAYLSSPLRYLLQAADRILVQTRLEYESVVRQGIPETRVVLQGLGVEPGECIGGDRMRAEKRWGLTANGAVRIGHLANLSEEKGSADLLRAFTRLVEAGVDARCVLAGPVMPNFRRFWRGLPTTIRGRIHYLGVLDDEEKPDFYATLDLFALPSRSDSFGLVLLEAWANGLPCVGYRAGGIAEVIRHDVDGVLVGCGDIDALASVLAALAKDVARRHEYGGRGRERVLRENQWADKLALVEDVYGEVAASRTAVR